MPAAPRGVLWWNWLEADVAELPHVLIVDDSRVVRISLIKNLKDHFEVREESDGEAAWQTLVVDHSIKAVISDLQMPKLNGYELLERLRTSKLRRLQNMPFILISGEETETERVKAVALGVSDFITKGSGTAELLTRLRHLLSLSAAQEGRESDREHLVQDPGSGLFTRKYLELQAAQALSHSSRHGIDMSVMVLAFDGFHDLSQRFGSEIAEEICNRFAKMLAGKVRREDSLGHYGSGQFAIVSPGTAPEFSVTFAERVREAVGMAKLAVRGETVALTVSIGVASAIGDKLASAAALLDLAGERMRVAMGEGGNRLNSGGVSPATRPISLNQALEFLAVGRSEPVVPHLPALLERLLPMLQLMDQELGLALPMAEIERRLNERKAHKN